MAAPLPPPHLVHYAAVDLVSALAAVLEEQEEELPAVARRTVRIETYIDRLGTLMVLHGQAGFRELIAPAESLEEIVVAFLAVLEYLRLGKATVRQTELYADIQILPSDAAQPVGMPAVSASVGDGADDASVEDW